MTRFEQVLSQCQSPVERRVAWVLYVDQEPVTISDFRDLGLDRRRLTHAVRHVRQLWSDTEEKDATG